MPILMFIGGKNPGSQIITAPGAGTFVIPYFQNSLRVRAFGAGGGGYGMSRTSGVPPPAAGGNTTFDTIIAGGAFGIGGTASGGDVNTNGNSGAPLLGAGAASPRTDLGGGAQQAVPPGNVTQNGYAGNPYGGGGSCGIYWSGTNRWGSSGGGSGAFVEKVYTPGSISGSISYNIGAGGLGGDGTSSDGGRGSDGALIIEWDYT